MNPLSNFVADAPNVVGIDAFARLADWLEREAELTRARGRDAGAEIAATVASGGLS